MKNILFFVLFFGICSLSNCKTQDVRKSSIDTTSLEFGKKSKIYFLDSIQASTAIITDEIDHFFERVTFTEMEIQMKNASLSSNRDVAIRDYKDFLSSDVESFTENDIENLKLVFESIKTMLFSINPNLLENDVQLIKTKGNHYGGSVYYTRENKIIIPANELENFSEKSFLEVMLHEYFHVFSRLHKKTRDEIYNLIGFQEVNGIIVLPEQLGKRKLLNPDGTTDYYIPLKNTEGKTVYAYPLISANRDHFTPDHPSFFEYLEFQLYELVPGEDNVLNLVVNEKGKSTIPFEKIPSFFQSIKDNTNYIIHPDEIMADNFIYAVMYLSKNEKAKNFSDEGMKLIESFGQIIKKFNQ